MTSNEKAALANFHALALTQVAEALVQSWREEFDDGEDCDPADVVCYWADIEWADGQHDHYHIIHALDRESAGILCVNQGPGEPGPMWYDCPDDVRDILRPHQRTLDAYAKARLKPTGAKPEA